MTSDRFDRRVVEVVTAYFEPIRGQRGKLKRLEQRNATKELAEELANSLSDVGEHEELVEACYYEIKQQLARLLHARELRTKQVKTLTDFLERDIKGALRRAVDRGIDLYGAAPHTIPNLIEETGIEIQQFLLNAKHEFIGHHQGTSEGLIDEKAQGALMEEIAKLEEEYALPAVELWLRQALGLIHLTRLGQELARSAQKARAAFDKGGDREQLDKEYRTAVQQIVKKSLKRIEAESLANRVKRSLTLHFKHVEHHHLSEEALNHLFH